VDADASAMAAASRSAAASVKKGGLPNALFLVESAERLPGPLRASAHLVTVILPWGSLLRGVLEANATIITALLDLLRPDGELFLMLSDIDEAAIDRLMADYRVVGFRTVEMQPTTESDVAALSSGWARRLGIPGSRLAWTIRLRR
jgi:16S rRNA (adenine(1408)-N(1))-methyltransferase